MVSLEDLVSPTHQYRKFREIWEWEEVHLHLESIKSPTCNGYGVTRLFSCLLLQFMEDVTDEDMDYVYQEIKRRS